MTDAEFQRFLADPSKRIDGDLEWSEEDSRLVGDLSEIARWSRPDDFRVLTAPAVG